MSSIVKTEAPEFTTPPPRLRWTAPVSSSAAAAVIDLGSSSDDESDGNEVGPTKKKARSSSSSDVVLPVGFLDPLPPPRPQLNVTPSMTVTEKVTAKETVMETGFKQFWKAGDYGKPLGTSNGMLHSSEAGMDHARVHPKFLHSNATSHKWAIGALAELLDNSLDEVSNGATFVNIDMLENKKDGTRMLLVEDDGGGMEPNKMRQCMSLGYSAKSKLPSTIGQYGNGFKTSTMRLGADVIVFSRSRGKDGRKSTQSIGILSYTFLRSTGKEDIIVPMLDYEKEQSWKGMVRTTMADWNTNLETIVRWSPYSSEADLLQQFSSIKEQGTRIVIYNLWEDDQGELELDFDADKHDIQIRGVNRDDKNIQTAKKFPNSKHFLTYRHSLRSYASILYLRLPHVFRMILRGKEIEHHNIVNDMMLKQEVTYKPQSIEGLPKDQNMVAVVTIGFVKDAKHHIDIQGFNVYHKNRLIKPFWRVWTAAGSGGRGVIGVLEANFIEPAHDKQDFERTTILSRLEIRLVQVQKTYWRTNSHRVGYAGTPGTHNNRSAEGEDRESSPEGSQPLSHRSGKDVGKSNHSSKLHYEKIFPGSNNKNAKRSFSSLRTSMRRTEKMERSIKSSGLRLAADSDTGEDNDPEYVCTPSGKYSYNGLNTPPAPRSLQKGSTCSASPLSKGYIGNSALDGVIGTERMTSRSPLKEANAMSNGNEQTTGDPSDMIKRLEDENEKLKQRIQEMEESMSKELQYERDRNKTLTEKLEEAGRQLEVATKEQEALIDIFSEERNRRDLEEENLRKKLKDASITIQDLLDKLNVSRKNHKP